MNVTVSQLNAYVKQIFSYDAVLNDITVTGELSGVKLHSSGHIYFSLKDENALIRCAFFKPHSFNVKFKPADGMKVTARGRVTLFERDGQYQLNVTELNKDGEGDLFKQFEELKKKLAQEGLFDGQYKKSIPKFARKIGVATSPTGAVIRDIMNVSQRRCPNISIVLAPVQVQGPDAPRSVIAGIDALENTADVDVIIVARGGGSAEDLHCFNNEELARRIFAAKKPVISAIGHETDFTICDFVSDLRAPTPSAAAELAVFDYYSAIEDTEHFYKRCELLISSLLEKYSIKIENYERFFSEPEKMLLSKSERLQNLFLRLNNGFFAKLSESEKRASTLKAKLDALNPINVLERGYAVVTDSSGKTVKDASKINTGEEIGIILNKGKIVAEVK